MQNLAISEEISAQEVADIFRDPYIAARMANDDFPSGPFNLPHLRYLAAKIDGKTVGAYAAIHHPDNKIEMHSMLQKQALMYSREFGQLALDWAFNHGAVVVYTSVDSRYKTVINYLKKCGLVVAGIVNDYLPKGGQLLDVTVMCISRDRWNKWAA